MEVCQGAQDERVKKVKDMKVDQMGQVGHWVVGMEDQEEGREGEGMEVILAQKVAKYY